jgi:hypothetical protein
MDLRVSKPLFIDCPMPVCAFAISGTYANLQRYLTYFYLVLCVIASMAPVLRGIAQAYLTATGISAAVHFITMFELQDRHIVDMDFLPALMYLSTGIIATLLWVLLRSTNKVRSYRDVIMLQALPFIFVNILLIAVAGMLKQYKLADPPAVLLDSEAAFRLTSICYQDSKGSAYMWAGTFNYPIRQSGELQYLLPSVMSHGQPASVFPMSISSALNGLVIGLVLQFAYMLLLGCMSLCGYQIRISKKVSLDFLRCTPEPLRRM